jgi:hypothetical protein
VNEDSLLSIEKLLERRWGMVVIDLNHFRNEASPLASVISNHPGRAALLCAPVVLSKTRSFAVTTLSSRQATSVLVPQILEVRVFQLGMAQSDWMKDDRTTSMNHAHGVPKCNLKRNVNMVITFFPKNGSCIFRDESKEPSFQELTKWQQRITQSFRSAVFDFLSVQASSPVETLLADHEPAKLVQPGFELVSLGSALERRPLPPRYIFFSRNETRTSCIWISRFCSGQK